MAQGHRIDVHHHPTPVLELMGGRVSGAPGIKGWTAAVSLEDMDKNGVATAILSMPSRANVWRSGDQARNRAMARQWNEFMTRQETEHPGRFGVFASVPIFDIEGSLREAEYALDQLKADGITLMTNMGDKWLGDPHYAPVFEELNRRGTILYTHPVAPNCCRDLLPELNDSVIEYGADTSRAIAKMIYGGSAARYPKMRVIFSHAGGSLPYSAFRFIRHSGRLGPELKANMPDGFVAMLNKFHYDTANTSNRYAMGSFRELIAISQLMFGTDFPFGHADHDAKSLRDCGFSDAELRAIECENAYRLWPRLKPAR